LCYSLFGAEGAFVTSQEQLLVLRLLAGLGQKTMRLRPSSSPGQDDARRATVR